MKKHSSKPVSESIPFSRGIRLPSRPLPPVKWVSHETVDQLASQGTTAHRIASSSLAWLERFGPDLLLSYKLEAARDDLLAQADQALGQLGLSFRRIFGKFIARAAEERQAPLLLRGDRALPPEGEADEAHLHYGLDFSAGYSAGLFIDQRENRSHLARLRPQKLLNTFAYTCSFSVVAARLGASTVNIDLSRKSLARGEDNFLRNGISYPGKEELRQEKASGTDSPTSSVPHRFLSDDVFAVLPRLAKRKDEFDCVILDPPTFSRNKKGEPFQVERDFGRLLQAALLVAAPGSHLLLSTNCSTMKRGEMEAAARQSLRLSARSGKFYSTPLLPDIPREQMPETVWLELAG